MCASARRRNIHPSPFWLAIHSRRPHSYRPTERHTSTTPNQASTCPPPPLPAQNPPSLGSTHSPTALPTLLLRDAIIGFADGLTVPFALCAGLSALDSSHIVITAGLAELVAGALSMGLGAALAALTDAKRYEVLEARARAQLRGDGGNGGDGRGRGDDDGDAAEAVWALFERYGVPRKEVAGAVRAVRARGDETWLRFAVEVGMGAQRPRRRSAPLEGVVMGMSYVLGECGWAFSWSESCADATQAASSR